MRTHPIVLGTAGHIDHGKTALVKALTGIDTDRLKVEKERGITTELGFAHLQLDGSGARWGRWHFSVGVGIARLARFAVHGRGSPAAQRSPAGSLSRGYGPRLASEESARTAQFAARDPLPRTAPSAYCSFAEPVLSELTG